MITIIGSGKVGGDAALFSALKQLDDQILLLDVAEGLPQGEAMDINHMLSEQGIDVEVKGSNNFADMKGSKAVVVVAGSGRKPGMTRMDLLKINASIVKSVVENIKKYADDSMIIPVTNPLDPMAYIAYKVSGFDRSRVFGMGGMLDLSRFRQFIHEPTVPVEPVEPTCGAGTTLVNGICQVVKTEEPKGGGCLIATAAYGSELAPQVQFLREIRDNTVMSTSSGVAFMSGFNQLYYSFSPTIADMERENPMFQEAVRAFITPMVSTLSIMTLADNGSEAEVLGLGISVIALNLGMYIAAPALIGFKVNKIIKSRK